MDRSDATRWRWARSAAVTRMFASSVRLICLELVAFAIPASYDCLKATEAVQPAFSLSTKNWGTTNG